MLKCVKGCTLEALINSIIIKGRMPLIMSISVHSVNLFYYTFKREYSFRGNFCSTELPKINSILVCSVNLLFAPNY